MREKGWKTILTRFLQIRKIKGVQWRVENGGECVNSANVVWKLLLGHFTGWLRPGKPDIDTFFHPPLQTHAFFMAFIYLGCLTLEKNFPKSIKTSKFDWKHKIMFFGMKIQIIQQILIFKYSRKLFIFCSNIQIQNFEFF